MSKQEHEFAQVVHHHMTKVQDACENDAQFIVTVIADVVWRMMEEKAANPEELRAAISGAAVAALREYMNDYADSNAVFSGDHDLARLDRYCCDALMGFIGEHMKDLR